MSSAPRQTPPAGRGPALPFEPSELPLTVHDAPPPTQDLASAQASRRGRLMMSLVLLACAAPVIASYFTYYVIRPQGRTNYATLVEPQRPLPAQVWHELDGRTVDAPTLRGQWLLVVVSPSQCDSGCEQRLFMQRQLREMMGKERDRVDKVWLITDEGPLAPALQQAVSAAPAAHALRVDRAQLATWLAPEAGHALDEHLYVVDPLGNWMMRAPAGADPMKLKKDLERLLRASAFWDEPGRAPAASGVAAAGAAGASAGPGSGPGAASATR